MAQPPAAFVLEPLARADVYMPLSSEPYLIRSLLGSIGDDHQPLGMFSVVVVIATSFDAKKS